MSEPTILEDYLELVTYGFTNPMPDADEGPWKITAKDVIGGEINFNTARKTTQEAYDTKLTKKSRPKIGDVLLTKDGTLGRLAIVQQEGLCINQSVAVLRPNQKILPEYLFYLLSTPDYQRQMIGDSDGTVIKHIYITRVGKMEVDIPSIEVQKARLKHLISLDGKIKNNRQTNQTLEHIAQALFKCWFVDFEPTRAKIIAKEKGANTAIQELAAQAIISGAITLEQLEAITQNLETTLQQAINEKLSQANQTPINTEQLKTTAALFPDALVDSELGEIPEGWSIKSLVDVAIFQNGFAFYTVGYSEEGYKVVDLANISTEGKFIETKRDKRIGTEIYNLPKHKKHHLQKNDIVMAMTDMTQTMGILGKCGKIYESNKFILNQRIGRIRAEKEMNVNFLLTSLNSKKQIDFLKNRVLGTVQKYVNTSHIKEMEFIVPPNKLMERFGEIVDPLFSTIRSNDIENEKLQETIEVLLPKLLSGELNVSSD